MGWTNSLSKAFSENSSLTIIIDILYELINFFFFSALIIIILLLKDKDFAYSSTICVERNLTNTNLHLV